MDTNFVTVGYSLHTFSDLCLDCSVSCDCFRSLWISWWVGELGLVSHRAEKNPDEPRRSSTNRVTTFTSVHLGLFETTSSCRSRSGCESRVITPSRDCALCFLVKPKTSGLPHHSFCLTLTPAVRFLTLFLEIFLLYSQNLKFCFSLQRPKYSIIANQLISHVNTCVSQGEDVIRDLKLYVSVFESSHGSVSERIRLDGHVWPISSAASQQCSQVQGERTLRKDVCSTHLCIQSDTTLISCEGNCPLYQNDSKYKRNL